MFGRQGEEKVAPEYLKHIARLSKLEVPAEKETQLCADLGKILAAVRHIQQVNTDGTARRARAPVSSRTQASHLSLRSSKTRH